MVKSVLMKTEERPRDKKKRILINFLLGLWMSAILALQLILYPPRVMIVIADELNLLEPFVALREKIQPFFKATDINMDFVIKF